MVVVSPRERGSVLLDVVWSFQVGRGELMASISHRHFNFSFIFEFQRYVFFRVCVCKYVTQVVTGTLLHCDGSDCRDVLGCRRWPDYLLQNGSLSTLISVCGVDEAASGAIVPAIFWVFP